MVRTVHVPNHRSTRRSAKSLSRFVGIDVVKVLAQSSTTARRTTLEHSCSHHHPLRQGYVNALWIPRCQQYSIQGHLVRFECIAMLRNACKRPSRRRTRYETQTCEVDESKANFSAPIPERQALAKQSQRGR